MRGGSLACGPAGLVSKMTRPIDFLAALAGKFLRVADSLLSARICQNCKWTNMLLVKTRLGPSTIHGIGVFADEDIRKGTIVWSFNPLIDKALTDEEIEGLPALAQEFIKIYGFWRDDLCVLCGDYGMFVNHSSTPNLESPEDQSIALRDIRKGEELTEDYDNYDDEPES
jgi:hypothetical protein